MRWLQSGKVPIVIQKNQNITNQKKRPAIFIDVNYNLEVEKLDEADKHEGQGDEQCGSNVQDEHVGLGSLFKAS